MFSRIAVLSCVLVFAGCHRAPPPSGSSCSLPSALVADVAGRADGIYGVVGEQVGDRPLVPFDALTRTANGVNADDGKPWFRFHLRDDAARSIGAFTAVPEGKSIVVVVAGSAAAHHKIRAPIEGADLQVSCCNPAACERWMKQLP